MKIIFITLLLAGASSGNVYAQGEMVNYSPKIITGHYITQNGDGLEKILREDLALKPGLSKSSIEKISNSIKRYNQFITNWNQIPANQKIYIEVPYNAVTSDSFLLKKRPAEAGAEAIKVEESSAQDEQVVANLEKKFRYSIIASTSIGTFKETSPVTGSKITSKQFSPLTLGMAMSMSDAESMWSFSGSAYFSYLVSQDVPAMKNITTTSINPPPEIGLTVYAQRMIVPQLFSAYAGLDAEKFSTLNLVEIEQKKTNVLSTREHTVIYGTIGSNFYLKVKDQPVNLRLSYSHSMISHVNAANINAYKGYKAIFYVQLPLNEHFYLNTFYKFHSMSGESELTVNRIGAGIGYLF